MYLVAHKVVSFHKNSHMLGQDLNKWCVSLPQEVQKYQLFDRGMFEHSQAAEGNLYIHQHDMDLHINGFRKKGF